MTENFSERVREFKQSAPARFARQAAESMVAAFLVQGGRIRKIPEAEPTTAHEVLQYLQSRNVKVELAPPKLGEIEHRYLYDGDIIDLHSLVDRANSHRRRQQLPPFEFKLRSRRISRSANAG